MGQATEMGQATGTVTLADQVFSAKLLTLRDKCIEAATLSYRRHREAWKSSDNFDRFSIALARRNGMVLAYAIMSGQTEDDANEEIQELMLAALGD